MAVGAVSTTLPEGSTKPTEPAAAAVGASDDGAEFVPAATFERPRDGYAFTTTPRTGVQGTEYYLRPYCRASRVQTAPP